MAQPMQQYGAGGQTGQQQSFGPQQGMQGSTGQQGQQYGQQQISGSQQAGATQQQPPGGMDQKLEEAISDEMRVALHDFVEAATACEWCAERCIDEGPQMAECLRLCRDVADLATLNIQLLSRDSVFGPEVAEVFAEAAEACGRECAQHPHKHCQECAEVLDRAARSTRKMIASFGPGQQPQMAAGGQF